MSGLLQRDPFGPRDDAALLGELNALTEHHRQFCAPFARMWPGHETARTLTELPFVHVGLFKRLELVTDAPGLKHGRALLSSGTAGAQSRVRLDAQSSALQALSVQKILGAFLGAAPRPLLVLDTGRSLRRGGDLAARLAAALSLRPLATDLHFLFEREDDPQSVRWELLQRLDGPLLIYGSTALLWQAWTPPEPLRARIDFVHSGGWKKLAAQGITRAQLDAKLLSGAGPGSRVLDYYGLAEQSGLVFPLCEHGLRHAPLWSAVLARDPFTLKPAFEGLLQLLNPLALGAPYHSVLTEDQGRVHAGPCRCGRGGLAFELLGRLPRAEVRGCADA